MLICFKIKFYEGWVWKLNQKIEFFVLSNGHHICLDKSLIFFLPVNTIKMLCSVLYCQGTFPYQEQFILKKMYCQPFCTIDEGHLSLYKYDFLWLFEYKFLQNLVNLVHLWINLGEFGAPMNKPCFWFNIFVQ